MSDIITIGIDPGLDGAITKCYNGEALDSRLMPTLKNVRRGSSKRFINLDMLLRKLKDLDEPLHRVTCVIEAVHAMPGQGVTSSFNFGYNFGIVCAMAHCMHWEILLVSPMKWKNYILKDYPRSKVKKEEKLRSVRYCLEHHGYHDLIPLGKRTYHDGIADSLCLAEYGYRQRKAEV